MNGKHESRIRPFRRLPLSLRLLSLIIPIVVLTITLYGYLNVRMIGRMLDRMVSESTREAAVELAADLGAGRIPVEAAKLRPWLEPLMDANFFIVRIDVLELSGTQLELRFSTSGVVPQSTLVDEEMAARQFRTIEVPQYREKEQLLKVIVPFRTGHGTGCVSVLSSLRQSEVVAQVHDRIALYLVPSAVAVLVVLLHFLFARGITRRIDRMSQVMRAARSGDLRVRADVGRDDELGAIARSFNETMDEIERAWQERDRLLEERSRTNAILEERVRDATRELKATNERVQSANEAILRAQRKLTQADRMAVVCQMAGTFAHEIGSPLSAVSTHLELLAEETGDNRDSARRIRLIQEQLDRITGFVEELLSETRAALKPRDAIHINELLERLLHFLEQHLVRLGVKLNLGFAASLPPVLASSDQLQQVFLNLVNNACDAMPDGGEVSITTLLETDSDGRPCVAVRVADTGGGIPVERQGRIFEPFFTTKEYSGGTGLGLSITARILRQHGGDIGFTSEPGAGTTFTVRLPVASDRADPRNGSGGKEAA